MIRKKHTRPARQPARQKLGKKAIVQLGELARKHASELRIDPEFERVKHSYSASELIDIVRAFESKRGKGRPISEKTQAWIERIRAEKRQGRGYLRLALEFRPDLPKESARAALRKFRNRWSQQIDA